MCGKNIITESIIFFMYIIFNSGMIMDRTNRKYQNLHWPLVEAAMYEK
jgi:hypothetical protein